MQTTIRYLFATALGCAVAAPLPAIAHSLESLQADLHENEQFFEEKNQPAPDFSLHDAGGRPVRLADFRGKVVVLNFVYTQCPDVCPLHAEAIAQVQEMVNVTPMKDGVAFVTVTTDPARDTPEILRAYGGDHGLGPANWQFLTSGPDQPEDATRKLAEAFGHTFTPTEDGMQMHGTVTHIVDQDGTWRGNFHGLDFEPVNLVTFVNALTNIGVPHGHEEEASSWWASVRSYF